MYLRREDRGSSQNTTMPTQTHIRAGDETSESLARSHEAELDACNRNPGVWRKEYN